MMPESNVHLIQEESVSQSLSNSSSSFALLLQKAAGKDTTSLICKIYYPEGPPLLYYMATVP